MSSSKIYRILCARQNGMALALLVLGLLLFYALHGRLLSAPAQQSLTAIWQRTQTIAAYRFSSTVVQVTLPTATVANIGRSSRTQTLYLEGERDLNAKRLEMRLWSQGGNVLQNESSLAIKVENGKSYMRQAGGAWVERQSIGDTLAPQGDVMAYLAAARNVTTHAPETLAMGAQALRFTRYTFQIDGPSFAAYVRDQMEAALRARGELPADVQLDLPAYYRDMTGTGELWVRENGLPLRQILELRFPEMKAEQVQARITVDFSHFELKAPNLSLFSKLGDGLRRNLPALLPLMLLLTITSGVAFLVIFRRSRRLEQVVTVTVIAALLLTPLLSSFQTAAFFDVQRAKAAAIAQEDNAQSETDALAAFDAAHSFDPHQDPLQPRTSDAPGTNAPTTPNLTAPNLQATVSTPQLAIDNGVDSDGDTLTDFVEERIGTDPQNADTDGDLLNDGQEVRGFDYAGQHWSTNPNAADSNNDGLADVLEWDANGDGAPDDLDKDGVPDLFDDDNDGDGVPDRLDSAPQSNPDRRFTEKAPMQLAVQNLEAGKPTFVDFQLRPADATHLWYAFNVLDWPSDHEGQIRDVDDKTFADVAGAASTTGNDANGDMKLVPMLEIRMSAASANLPQQRDLTPYNISVNNFTADGSEKVVYVPLSVVTDDHTGQRVAFSGRMRYLPTGQWPTPHSVRLAWVVQGLMDIPCDPQASNALAQGCAGDGYIHNAPQVVQSYYDDWTLTGLNVSEEHGATMALIYEDPAVDPNKKEDGALWTLAFGLDNSFVGGRDQDQNGKRDVDTAELVRRFDHTVNGAVSASERWGLVDSLNLLRVERTDYATLDQAIFTTAMTETKRILNDKFNSVWSSDKAIQPLLLFAHETSSRGVDLDGASDKRYMAWQGNGLTVDLQPPGQPKLPLQVLAGIKATPYCAPDAPTPLWSPCETASYWKTLEQRYANSGPLPGDDPANLKLRDGRLFLTELYGLALLQGANQVVERDQRLVSSRYRLLSDTEVEGTVRTAATVGASVAKSIANYTVLAAVVDKVSALEFLGNKWQELKTGTVGSKLIGAVRGSIDILSAFRTGGSTNRWAGVGIVSGVALGVSLLAGGGGTWAYFLFKGNPGAKFAVNVAERVITTGLTLYSSVISPIKASVDLVKQTMATGQSLGSALKFVMATDALVLDATRAAGAVGAVLSIGATWGFFIYSMVASHISAFSPQFNAALAEAIAATIYVIVLAVLSATVIGTIIVGVIAFIDAVLTAICELGVKGLRKVPGMGGACFTLSTSAIKVIAKVLYSFDVMVDTERQDLAVTGAPIVTLADPSRGYVADNPLTVALPVTTTIVHKNPDPTNWQILFYQWLYSKDNLRSSTFRYSLTRPTAQAIDVQRDQMPQAWQNVQQDHKWALTSMLRGQASSLSSLAGITLTAGINQSVSPWLNLGYAIPAYECWSVPNLIPPFIPQLIPVCYTRTVAGNNSTQLAALRFDILPATVGALMATASKGDGGLGLAWDNHFPSLSDADGDGLNASIHGGLDPNDQTPDSDGDGLTDAFELERRQAGDGFSPVLRDSDNDGLSDAQELLLGTDPALADTDNDGLKDGEEVWHATGNGNQFTGGWNVTINGATPLTVHVSSDPLNADSDGDGLSDGAERALASQSDPTQRVDLQNRPYHPGIFNVSPINVYVSSDDADGFVFPNQLIHYNTTAVVRTAVAPGVVDVTSTSDRLPPPYPMRLDFAPQNFNISQTVSTAGDIRVGLGTPQNKNVTLTSRVRTRLPGSPGPQWVMDPVALGAPLGGFSQRAFLPALAPATIDRQDRYQLTALTSDLLTPGGKGDIWRYQLPTGQSGTLENDNGNVTFLRGATSPSVACNAAGACMVVWDQYDNCNVVTIESLKVVQAGPDHGTSGIEPLIYFVGDSADTNPQDGGFQLKWDAMNNGGIDMRTNDVRGPNAYGFPITLPFCGNVRLDLREGDGTASYDPNPALTQWDQLNPIASATLDPAAGNEHTTILFDGSANADPEARHKIELTISTAVRPHDTLGGVLIRPDGGVQPLLFGSTGANTYAERFQPVVASDGANFVVVNETAFIGFFGPGSTRIQSHQYDANGVLQASQLSDPPITRNFSPIATATSLALVWAGNAYRLVEQNDAGGAILLHKVNPDGVINPPTPLANDGCSQPPETQLSLAYHPLRNELLLGYTNRSDRNIIARYSVDGAPLAVLDQGAGGRARVAYHPNTQGYLALTTDTGRNLHVRPLDSNGAPLAPDQGGFPTLDGTGSALSCPAPQSTPVVDLRFEELPGATAFQDSSGFGNHATCPYSICPHAGEAGAPNAPGSDYALGLDGLPIAIPRPVQDDFTIAFWYKGNSGVLGYALVDAAWKAPNGFGLAAQADGLHFSAGGATTLVPIQIFDQRWNFVTATRRRATGELTLYVNGQRVTGATGNTQALTQASQVTIGEVPTLNGVLDHFQIFPSAFSADAVQALFQRTMQSYCVAASTTANPGVGIQWGQVVLRQPDRRGSAITAQGVLNLTVDTDNPTGTINSVTNGQYLPGGKAEPRFVIIGGNASDATSKVAKVQLSVNGGDYQLANGAETWAFPLTVGEGTYSLQSRVTDVTGHEGQGQVLVVIGDATPPTVTLSTSSAVVRPQRDANNRWFVNLSGTVSDPAIGDRPGSGVRSVSVSLESAVAGIFASNWQTATINGGDWTLNYLLPPGVTDPTGVYTLIMQASDKVGNQSGEITRQRALTLDAAGPVASLTLAATTPTIIATGLTLTGQISDTVSGVSTLDVSFIPITQVLQQPDPNTLNWQPATLSATGTGALTSTWRIATPSGLEGEYQIALRTTDMLGNTNLIANAWRGVIDTLAPRVVLKSRPTGAFYKLPDSGELRYAVTFVCAAQDRYLDANAFQCPANPAQPPVRSFVTDELLQSIFPDYTLRDGLAISYTNWMVNERPAATMHACDIYGNCASADASLTEADSAPVAAAADSPYVTIVDPTDQSMVAADGVLSVTVAAAAPEGLQQATLLLDGNAVQTLEYARDNQPVVRQDQRVVALPIAGEGAHTLSAELHDLAGNQVIAQHTVHFTLDAQPPTLTIDKTTLTLSDTWQIASGILRFNGEAKDTLGLSAVQVSVDQGAFADATFANGRWTTSQFINAPEGRTLPVTVRAIDLAGRISEVTEQIATALSVPNAPDTTIQQGPDNPSHAKEATFVFNGVAVGNEVAGFVCQLDSGLFLPCTSPQQYTNLAKGLHSFRVRAVDTQGFVDPTPATFTWNIDVEELQHALYLPIIGRATANGGGSTVDQQLHVFLPVISSKTVGQVTSGSVESLASATLDADTINQETINQEIINQEIINEEAVGKRPETESNRLYLPAINH